MYLLLQFALPKVNGIMKHLGTFIIILTLSINLYAQDTLQKVIEYDVSLESVAKIDNPIFQKYITSAGERNWLEVLIKKASTAKLFLFQRDLYYGWYTIPKVPPIESIGRIDSTTYEEFFDQVILDNWDTKNITAIRFHKKLVWNNEQSKWDEEFSAFAPLFQTHLLNGSPWDQRVYFWIPLTELYNRW